MPNQKLVVRPAGLWTNPSVYGAAPEGGLKEAVNVVLRRPGVIEPRPGLPLATQQNVVPLSAVHALLEFPGTGQIMHIGSPAAPATDTTYISNAAVRTPSNAVLSWTRGREFGAAARKNLYLTTADALRKISAGTDTEAPRAGVPPPIIEIVGDSAGSLVPTGTYYSYRAVKVRKDANGLEVRSEPSNRVIFGNTSVSTRNPEIRLWQHENDDNDPDVEQWEIYRSVASTSAEVPDEHFLLRSFGPQPTDTNLTWAFTDSSPDADLGAPLYTNEDEEGLAHANLRPPQANAAAEFNGSLVLGDLTFPAQHYVEYQYTSGMTAATDLGIGERTLTGTYTNGSAVVTGVADTTGVRVGMIVVDTAATEWGDPNNGEYTRVESKTANSVTMTAVYTGATGAKTRTICDSIRVGARYFPVRERALYGNITFWNNHSVPGEVFRSSADVYAFTDDTYTYTRTPGGVTNTGPVTRTLTLRAVLPTSSPFVVYATHGDEYNPPLPEPTATGLTADQEIFPSAVLWSKAREPEHFSALDLQQLGGDHAEVWSLVKGGDGLWVLKQDGTHRLTGADRDAGFRIDRVSSAKVLHPKAAAESGDRAYAWCDAGLLELTSGATALPTLAIANRLRAPQSTPAAITNYGLWLCANTKANEIILSRPETNLASVANSLHVFNKETQSWVEWDLEAGGVSCGLYASSGPASGLLFFGLGTAVAGDGDDFITRREVLPTEPQHFDNTFAFTGTVLGTTLTITGGNWADPAVGDAVIGSDGGTYTVTAVASPTSVTLSASGLTIGADADAYSGFDVLVTTIAQTANNPSVIKLWGEGSLLFGFLDDIYTASMEFESSVHATGTALPASGFFTLEDAANGRSVRFLVPRTHARSEQLYVSYRMTNNVDAEWRLEGLSLFYNIMGHKTRT